MEVGGIEPPSKLNYLVKILYTIFIRTSPISTT
nr:MAG TPA: hypothetical protein [Caudoviricetes sp.]